MYSTGSIFAFETKYNCSAGKIILLQKTLPSTSTKVQIVFIIIVFYYCILFDTFIIVIGNYVTI